MIGLYKTTRDIYIRETVKRLLYNLFYVTNSQTSIPWYSAYENPMEHGAPMTSQMITQRRCIWLLADPFNVTADEAL